MPFLFVMEVWKRLNREKENYKQGKSKDLSIVSLGKARWYWIVWPSTASGVQEAYRKLVKNTHPDGGGNHDTFLELQTANEQAMRRCR
jgi:hypothetical protein